MRIITIEDLEANAGRGVFFVTKLPDIRIGEGACMPSRNDLRVAAAIFPCTLGKTAGGTCHGYRESQEGDYARRFTCGEHLYYEFTPLRTLEECASTGLDARALSDTTQLFAVLRHGGWMNALSVYRNLKFDDGETEEEYAEDSLLETDPVDGHTVALNRIAAFTDFEEAFEYVRAKLVKITADISAELDRRAELAKAQYRDIADSIVEPYKYRK